ncbi:MAG: NUDIX domain-containing protein [Candidatus Pacearchaeota archaeon]
MRKAINLAVVYDSGLLLVRKKNAWILPGGKPEEGEGHYETLERVG